MVGNNLGKKLRDLRKARKLTQQDIADRFKVTRGTVSNWEIERREPDLKTLEKLAAFYNVSLDYFAVEKTEDQLVEILDRARDILNDDSVPVNAKQKLYEEIMRLYLKSKGD